MKMSKKLLCMLLSCLMLFSSMAVGVTAYDDYRTPDHINSLGKPVYTYDQYCSAICDFIDVLLYKADINEKIDLKIYSAQLDLRSIDQAFDSITDFLNSGLIKFALTIGVAGDLNKIDIDSIESVRRSKNKDKDVIYALLEFLYDNRDKVIKKILNDSFGWGLIDNFMDEEDYPYLFNTAQFLRETVYKLIEEKVLKNTVTTVPSTFDLDAEVQKVVDHFLVNEGVGDFVLPSMAGKTDVYNQSAYDFIQNLIDAAFADFVLPMLMEKLPDVLNIETSKEIPYGDREHPGLLPTIIGIINDYLHLGYEGYEENIEDRQEPVKELQELLTWFLVGTTTDDGSGALVHNPAAIYEIIQFTDHGVDIRDSIIDDVKLVLRTLGPGLVGQFMDDYFPDGVEAPEGMEEYTTDQVVSYYFNLLIPKLLPGVRILPGCDTVRECLTYTAIYFAIDIVPEYDYYGEIEAGHLNPEGNAWIEIAAKIGAYYVKNVVDAEDASIDTVQFDNTVSFDTLIGKLADWAIANYGFLANTRQNFSTMGPWEKLDAILFGLLDPTMMTIDLNRAPYTSYSYYTEALIKGCILEGLANLDIEQILGFVGRRNSGGIFNGSLISVIITLVKKILSALMNGNTVVPTTVTNIELLFEKNNLGDLVANLCNYLYTERDYNFNTIIPLVASLMGLNDTSRAKIYAPESDPTRSMEDLIALVNSIIPDNGDLKYNDDDYFTYGSEDFTEYYKFDDFKDTLKDVRALIAKYEQNPTSVNQIDINDNYYRLNTYWSRLVYKTNTTSKKICKTQLVREITYAGNNIPTENYSTATEGKIYTDRSWRLYTEALAFANKINNMTNVHQSRISLARQELFKAIDALKAYKPLANYRALDTLIARAEAIDPATYARYTTDSMRDFKLALAAAKSLDRDYDQDDQSIVNRAASNLSTAMNGLVVWEINYELGADIVIAPSVAQDSTTVLKFKEGTGATVTDVSATVDNGATITAPYTDGDYTCWVIDPSNSPLYTMVTATISFTQPDTGRTYTAKAYTFVDSSNYAITFNVNTCLVGKARNVYAVYVNGIKSADTRTVNFALDYSSGSATCTTTPTGTVFVDVSQGYTDLSEIPGLGFTYRKNADTYTSNYAGGGTHSFSSVEVSSIESSNKNVIGVSRESISFDVNTTQSETVGFTGAIPAAGGSKMVKITSTMKATSTAGGTDTSVLSFNLRVNAYNKKFLREAVNDAIAACRQEWFYSSGWDIYTRDLVRAVTVLNNPVTTQAEIDEATANLLEAIEVLEFKDADLVNLYKAMTLANSIDAHNYKSIKAVNDILAEINASDLSRGILDQALVNDFTERLLEAIDALEPAKSKIYIRCYDSSAPIEVEGEVTGYTLISSDTVNGDVGDKMRIDIPEVIGYAPDEGQDKASFVVTYEDNYVDFYYSPLTYKVTLNPQGGQLDNRTVTVTYGHTYDNLPVPTRNGFVFNGWYTKASGGYLVDETTRVTTGHYISLYAHWSIATSSGESIDDMSMTDIIKTGDTMSFIQKLQSWMVNIWNFILDLFK